MKRATSGCFGGSVLCFAFLAAMPALAQAPDHDDKPETSNTETGATFRSKVTLVTVPVVVRDRHGKAVGNLQKEDFQLFDRGKQQTISKFAMEKADVPDTNSESLPAASSPESGAKFSEAMPSQFVAYVFDDLHLDAANLSVLRPAAEKHLAGLASSVRAAVFTTSGVNMLDFTGDRAKLKDALRLVSAQSREGTKKTDCPYISYYMADLILNEHDPQALEAAIMEAISCGAHLGPMAEALVRSAAKLALSIGDLETQITVRTLKEIIHRMGTMPGQRVIVLVSPGFLVKREHFEVPDMIASANRLNVTINSLDTRGVYVTGRDSTDRPAHGARALLAIDNYERDDAMGHSGVLEEIARETGGECFHDNNDLYGGLQQRAAFPAFIYWLGFSPENLQADGKPHSSR